ncbi:MAG: helix-turn-helix domain-containing protein [Stagnimonas sp.]|nr:helix-turn-helix domain-containing protein [Stagnimonas sp.]
MSLEEGPVVGAVRLGRGRRPQTAKVRDARDAAYREHIFEVAEKLFAEQGFDNTRMQDIAAAAGISLGTLYQSYPGKRELHRGLLTGRDQQMLDAVVLRQKTMARSTAGGMERILWMLEANLRFLLQHPDYLRMHLHEGHAWYNRAADGTQDQDEVWTRGQALMEQVFNWGMAEGWFSPGVPAHMARLVVVNQQTRLANWVIDGLHAPHEQVLAQIQADFVRLFCTPAVIARLLSGDGSGLSEQTLQTLRAMSAMALASGDQAAGGARRDG